MAVMRRPRTLQPQPEQARSQQRSGGPELAFPTATTMSQGQAGRPPLPEQASPVAGVATSAPGARAEQVQGQPPPMIPPPATPPVSQLRPVPPQALVQPAQNPNFLTSQLREREFPPELQPLNPESLSGPVPMPMLGAPEPQNEDPEHLFRRMLHEGRLSTLPFIRG